MAQEILVRLRDTPELLDADIFSDTGRLPTPTNAHQGQGGLPVELKNVVFHHVGASSPALRKVSLDIASGAYVAIVGPSGAGKTTLVDLLLGLYDPDKGSVRVGGEDPRALRENSPGLLS
jgi:ABC-type multidrug transport system fused ATPase/permease subunit